MKKILIGIFCAALAISMVGCSVSVSDNGVSDNGTADNAVTTTTTTTTQPQKTELWEMRYFVDEFDQPTNEWYVSNKDYIVGTFCNSATEDSRLYVQIIASADETSFVLYEYGRNMVKNSYSRDKDYTIVMKDAAGKKYELSGYIYSGGDRVLVKDAHRSTIVNALKGSGTISFYIYETERTVTNYLFEVETSNFGELIK